MLGVDIMNNIFLLGLLSVVLATQTSSTDDREIAQCLLTKQELTIMAPIKTPRGQEFVQWKIENIQADSVLGEHAGAEVTNPFDQSVLSSGFGASIGESTTKGEVYIDIKKSDLGPMSSVTDFNFRCNIIAY